MMDNLNLRDNVSYNFDSMSINQFYKERIILVIWMNLTVLHVWKI